MINAIQVCGSISVHWQSLRATARMIIEYARLIMEVTFAEVGQALDSARAELQKILKVDVVVVISRSQIRIDRLSA